MSEKHTSCLLSEQIKLLSTIPYEDQRKMYGVN